MSDGASKEVLEEGRRAKGDGEVEERVRMMASVEREEKRENRLTKRTEK